MNRAPRNGDQDPQPGDLIEIFRVGYQHWAVYVGDGDVVHLTGQSGSGSVSGNISGVSVGGGTAMVKRERLQDVVGTNRWRVNNELDRKNKPRPAHVIVREARSQVGNTQSYAIFGDNCEDFATKLRYGKKFSRQVLGAVVMSMVTGVVAGGAAGVILIGAGALGLISYMARR